MESLRNELADILAKINDLTKWRASTDGRLTMVESTLKTLKDGQDDIKASQVEVIKSLNRNNEMTEMIRDAVGAAKVTRKLLAWVAAVAVSLGTIWGAVWSAVHTSTPAPSETPKTPPH